MPCCLASGSSRPNVVIQNGADYAAYIAARHALNLPPDKFVHCAIGLEQDRCRPCDACPLNRQMALRVQHFSKGGIKQPNPGEKFAQLRCVARL